MLASVFAAFFLGQLFSTPIIGDITDQIGRKKVFFITIAGTALCFLFSAIFIHTGHLILLIISRFLTGIFAANMTVALAALVDLSSTKAMRFKHFSIVIILRGISVILALIFGIYLLDSKVHDSFHPGFPFQLISLLLFLTLIPIALYYKDSHVKSKKAKLDLFKGIKNIREIFLQRKLLILYSIYCLYIAGWAGIFTWNYTYTIQTFNIANDKAILGYGSTAVVFTLTAYLINLNISKRYYKLSSLTISITITTISGILMWLSPDFLTLIMFYCLALIGAAISWPMILYLISINGSPNDQGKLMGISQSMSSIGFILSSVLGALFGGGSGNDLFLITCIPMTLSLLLLYFNRHTLNERKE